MSYSLKLSDLAGMMAAVGLSLLSACTPFKLQPPPGFVEVQDYERHTRMKAHDHVGLSVRTFNNVRGGTLAYWAEDMVNKLGARGYTLQGQQAVKSKNGRVGTRFNFSYTPPGTTEQKFYVAVLFVTDKYRTILQIAGDAKYSASYQARVDGVLADLAIRGCKLGSKICSGAQPGPLRTTPPSPMNEQSLQPEGQPGAGVPGAEQPVTPTVVPANQPA